MAEKKLNMPKCPKCEAEIEILSYSNEEYGKFRLDNEGHPFHNVQSGDGYNYNCPECGHIIAFEEEKAIKFLRSC